MNTPTLVNSLFFSDVAKEAREAYPDYNLHTALYHHLQVVQKILQFSTLTHEQRQHVNYKHYMLYKLYQFTIHPLTLGRN